MSGTTVKHSPAACTALTSEIHQQLCAGACHKLVNQNATLSFKSYNFFLLVMVKHIY
jgi:hypothetical protein